jgi:bifunctional DNA-binding transcriptional regulator/antitoxin component of YhaV-PrlF toxin-antitoxin module
MATTTKSDELIAHLEATTTIATLGSSDGVALPEKIRRAAGLAEGDTLYVEAIDDGDGGIRVQVRKIDPDQRWGWTPESQAAIREAEENYAAGRFTRYYSTDEFLAELDKRAKHADV